MPRIPSRRDIAAATENAVDKAFRGGVADLRRRPADVIDRGPQRTTYRYVPMGDSPPQQLPVLLVPPLASPSSCFDLRPGCSLAEYLLALDYPTYLVEYGAISYGDRALGLEHWVEEVLPSAADAVRSDSGAKEIQLVGWCLGGIMSLLSVADGTVPAASVALVASPFDFTQVRLMAPIRAAANVTGGAVVTSLYRLMGGAPAPLVRAGFRLSSIDKQITKPVAVARNLHDREALAQIEAVDEFMASMLAYPGRTFGQLYHRFFLVNELSGGRLSLSDHEVDLADVTAPVLSVAGDADVLAPKPAVHHVAELLPNASVRLESSPGGHLGVLTGRSAERTTWAYLDEFLLETQPAAAR